MRIRAFPVALIRAALAGKAFTPLNYRWPDAQLVAAVRRLGSAAADDTMLPQLSALATEPGVEIVGRDEFLASADTSEPAGITGALPQRPAVQLFTSGTSGAPKGPPSNTNLAAHNS